MWYIKIRFSVENRYKWKTAAFGGKRKLRQWTHRDV